MMIDHPETQSLPCPVCGRAFDLPHTAGDIACSRCGSDLQDYCEIILRAKRLLMQSAYLLPSDPQQALQRAERAQRLHASDAARQMVLLAKLCARQYPQVLMDWFALAIS